MPDGFRLTHPCCMKCVATQVIISAVVVAVVAAVERAVSFITIQWPTALRLFWQSPFSAEKYKPAATVGTIEK